MAPAAPRPRIVIVGGGFGGLATARGLSDFDAEVILVDRANHHLFQPLLYQVAMAGLSPADIAVPIRRVLRAQRNIRVLLAEVHTLDPAKRELGLDDGSVLSFDYLVLAVGAKTNFFGNEDRFARHALGLKSVDDALEIRRRVLCAFEAAERESDEEVRRRLLSFIIIGGGPTGVELAGALSDLARTVLDDEFRVIDPTEARVIVLERAKRLLPGGFDESLAARAKVQLEELGVEVMLKRTVTDITPRGVLLGEERLDAATVIWTAGVRGVGLVERMGVELDAAKRIVVNQDCSLPHFPNIFAIGDVARFVPPDSEQPLPGVAPVAAQQGRHTAKNILRLAAGKEPEPFKYVDKGIMATIGRSRAVAQTWGGRLRLTGFLAWLAWLFVHIWFLIDFQNRVSVLLNWFWNYVTYRRGARLITGERPWELAERLAAPPPTSSERTEGKALAAAGAGGAVPQAEQDDAATPEAAQDAASAPEGVAEETSVR